MKPEKTVEELVSNIKKRDYKVGDDGSVTLVELVESRIVMTAPQFSTFYRDTLKAKEEALRILGEDEKKKIEEELEKTQKQIDLMVPIVEESEDKAKAFHENKKREANILKVKEELAKPKSEQNVAYLHAVLQNLQANDEDMLLNELTDEEKKRFAKIKLQFKQSQRRKK